MTDFLKIAKSIAVHFAHICAYGVETVKDGYLNLLLHYKKILKRGWVGRKKWLKKRIECFFQSLT